MRKDKFTYMHSFCLITKKQKEISKEEKKTLKECHSKFLATKEYFDAKSTAQGNISRIFLFTLLLFHALIKTSMFHFKSSPFLIN